MAIMSALPDPPPGADPTAVLPEPTFTPGPAAVEQIEAVRSAKQEAWRTEPLARKVAYARRQGARGVRPGRQVAVNQRSRRPNLNRNAGQPI